MVLAALVNEPARFDAVATARFTSTMDPKQA